MSQIGETEVFPELSGTSLTGREMLLPDDFAGDTNLVFVAFRMRHQRDVDRWLEELDDIEDRHEGLLAYEVPLLRRYPSFYRKWIDDGMRSGISDPTTRSRTVTVYTNRRRFLDAVGLQSESEILVLLEAAGRVLWAHVGAATREAIDGLNLAIGRLQT